MNPGRVVKAGATLEEVAQEVAADINARIQGAAATGYSLGVLFAADAVSRGATPAQLRALAAGKAPPLEALPHDAPIWADEREVRKCGTGGHVQVPGAMVGKRARVAVLR